MMCYGVRQNANRKLCIGQVKPTGRRGCVVRATAIGHLQEFPAIHHPSNPGWNSRDFRRLPFSVFFYWITYRTKTKCTVTAVKRPPEEAKKSLRSKNLRRQYLNKNSSVDEIANVNVFTTTCRGQRLRPLNRLPISILIYAAANQGRSSTSFIATEPAQ